MGIDEQLGAKLAAYLDGESSEAERQEVETLIRQEPEARRALDEMREARELLRRYDTETGTTTAETHMVAPDLSGQRLDHFIVESRIGRGGMGEVYKALDSALDRSVAIKLISPTLAATAQLVDRFVREARLQGQIDHPHVAHVYYVGRHEGRAYFAMEYLPGGSLQSRLEGEGGLDPDEAIDIIVEVADILDSTKRRGIVHRDLKPANIMFTADGNIKLTDFGIAKPIGEEATQLTASGAILGTPHYVSPEAATGEEVTWRSDMYSLGCTLYHLLFGRPPYHGKGAVQLALAHVREPFPEPEEPPPGVGPELMDVLRCMMAKDPEQRFPDYPSLIEALNSARPRIIEPISPWKRLGVGLLDSVVVVGVFVVVITMVYGILAMAGAEKTTVGARVVSVVLWAALAVLCTGVIPALSGSTLVQGILSMKVRSETARKDRKWQFLWRGMIAHPLATLLLVALAVWLLQRALGENLLGLLIVLGWAGWHVADFVAAFFNQRRRMLHDILSRTRLQYVTFRD